MNIKVNLSNRGNYGSQRSTSNIKYIVIHYTGNDGDSDEGNANYFKNIRNASAHYFVDDDSVTQSVPDNYTAWSVGGNKYPSCEESGGGKWYGKCTNTNSISIELCDSVKNGVYDFTENTLKQAAELVKQLMAKYNVPIENVIRHFDVVGKICPLPFVREPKQWEAFKNRLVDGDKDLEKAVANIVDAGYKINATSWNSISKMKMQYVPGLIKKLGGIDEINNKITSKGMTFDVEKWKYQIKTGAFNASNVRSLLIKFSQVV